MLRILSLLPAATDIVYLLGLEKYLVGTSYSIHLDTNMLKKLRPNLILTQKLCKICAVEFNEVKRAARILDGDTKIISLEPESVEDILQNILTVGEITGGRQQAGQVVKKLKKRIENLKFKIENSHKPKVCVLEWLDPLMVAGHWIPEMVEVAGGVNVISEPGEKSKIVKLYQIIQSKPDILVISPCGFDIKRTIIEKSLIVKLINKLGKISGVYLIDGNSYMTRPGPRIIDGIEILSEILHPDIFPRRYTKRDWIKFR